MVMTITTAVIQTLLGFCLGFIRECLVIQYTQAVIHKRSWRGALVSLIMGHLDLFVIAALSWNKLLLMALAFVWGESAASKVFIGKKNG